MENNNKKKGTKAVRLLENIAIPSFKHVAIHLVIATLLLGLSFLIFKDAVKINSNTFVGIVSSIAAASGALLAISAALAIFFSSHITNWRDKQIERLEKGREGLAHQMAETAKQYPEISRRLSVLYMKSAFYVTGQPIDSEEIFKASKVYDDWAKEESTKAINDNRKFDFGNLDTYKSYAKQLFDSTICINKVRGSLILLSVAEISSRIASVFPPQLTAWGIILLFSLVFAILGGIGTINAGLYMPMLLMLLYLITIALIATIISSSNIIMFITRGLEKGSAIAMEELVNKSILGDNN